MLLLPLFSIFPILFLVSKILNVKFTLRIVYFTSQRV